MLCVYQLMMDVSGMILVLHGKGFVVAIMYVEVIWNLLSFVVIQLYFVLHLNLIYLKQSHLESAYTVMDSANGLVSYVLKTDHYYFLLVFFSGCRPWLSACQTSWSCGTEYEYQEFLTLPLPVCAFPEPDFRPPIEPGVCEYVEKGVCEFRDKSEYVLLLHTTSLQILSSHVLLHNCGYKV